MSIVCNHDDILAYLNGNASQSNTIEEQKNARIVSSFFKAHFAQPWPKLLGTRTQIARKNTLPQHIILRLSMLLNIVVIAISTPLPRPPHNNVDCCEKNSCTREVNIVLGGEREGNALYRSDISHSVARVLASVV